MVPEKDNCLAIREYGHVKLQATICNDFTYFPWCSHFESERSTHCLCRFSECLDHRGKTVLILDRPWLRGCLSMDGMQ